MTAAAAAATTTSQELSHLARPLDHHAQRPNIPFGVIPDGLNHLLKESHSRRAKLLAPEPRPGQLDRNILDNKIGMTVQYRNKFHLKRIVNMFIAGLRSISFTGSGVQLDTFDKLAT